MQDPNTSKVEDIDFESMATPVEEEFDFEAIATPIQKKSEVGNESTTPSQQPTTPSATSTSESKKVTTEFGEPAVMLEEVEIKPKPEIGYLQSFMEGIESYDDLQVGYDVLRSGDKAKIIDYYNTRYNNSLNQTPNDNFIKNALRTIGGTVPMMGKVATGGAVGGAIGSTIPVVGTAVGAASGTIAEGIYEGQKLSKSSAFEEAYFEAKSQNKTDDEAFEIANSVSKVAQIAGGVEGGISGLAGGTATKAGTGVLKNLAKEIIADATVGATAAGARRGTENIAAQQQGLERKTTAGIGEEMTGEAAFSFGLGLLLSPITQGKNLIGNRRKKIITAVAATDAPKAITTIDKAVEKGEVSQEDADALKIEIVQTAKAFEATPESMPYEEREALTPTVAERQKLQKELEKADDLTKPFVELKINELDKKVAIPLPPKYMNTAGQNTSELKDGQLYITRKGDVRMWDAAQKRFLEPPKSFEVEAKKETEQVKPTEEVAPQPEVVTEQPAAETVQAEAEVAPESQAKPLQTEAESQVATLPTAEIDQVDAEVQGAEIKPNKQISVAQGKAIKEVTESLNADLKDMEATMLFSKFKDNVDAQLEVGEGLTSKQFEKLEEKGYVEQPSSFRGEYTITEKGKQFIDRVKARIETRRNVKLGIDMFPELANISEFQPIQKTIQKKIDNGEITTEVVEQYGNKSKSEIESNEAVVADIERKAESNNEAELNEVVRQSNELIGQETQATPIRDAFAERQKTIDTSKIFEGAEGIKEGDYIRTPTGTAGFVVKVNPKNVTIESLYGGWGGSDSELMQLKIKKSDIAQHLKQKSQVGTPTSETNIFDQYDNTKGASKKDKVIEQYAKESGKDKADRVRDIIDNFDAIKSRLQELISEGKIDNIEIRC